ncbi:hypothetical protein ACFV4N_22850 [Actinosynnema sp. NPDC059797]
MGEVGMTGWSRHEPPAPVDERRRADAVRRHRTRDTALPAPPAHDQLDPAAQETR